LVKRHPLIAFFVLAFALSWWPWILYAFGPSPTPIASFGPFLAALVVLAITQGKSGIGGLLRRMVRWRVGIRWYAVALLLPVGIALAATALNVLLGAQAPSAADLGGWTGLFSIFAVRLLIPGTGGAWEEPGWRGFALPSLQAGRSALVASLILGAVWALWHLPLVVATGQMGGWDIVSILAWTLVLTWVYNGTGGSVLIIMLFHAMFNTVSVSFISPLAFSGADSVRQSWLLAAVWCAVAVAVVMWAGPKHLSHKLHKQEEEGGAEEPGTATPSGAVKPVPA
jgi:membrane protease YdiL (CAAX protease family)